MFEFEKPKIEIVETSDDNKYGKFVIEPLERGYGITLGNSLRRIMLSSLPGTAVSHVKIKGVFHTVNPVAMERYKVFSLNAREYTLIHTQNFGDAVYAEIGALCVGKIVNTGKTRFVRGEEKGYFEFGGSTVIVVLEKGAAIIDADIRENAAKGYETKVKSGEKIGEKPN